MSKKMEFLKLIPIISQYFHSILNVPFFVFASQSSLVDPDINQHFQDAIDVIQHHSDASSYGEQGSARYTRTHPELRLLFELF